MHDSTIEKRSSAPFFHKNSKFLNYYHFTVLGVMLNVTVFVPP